MHHNDNDSSSNHRHYPPGSGSFVDPQPSFQNPYGVDHHHHDNTHSSRSGAGAVPMTSSQGATRSVHSEGFLKTYFGLGFYNNPDAALAPNSISKEAPECPPGMEIRISKNGYPYFAPIALDADDVAAQNEHVRQNVSLFGSSAEMLAVYGSSIYLYFDFIKYLCVMNILLSGFTLGNWIPHILHWDHDTSESKLIPLFISSYSSKYHAIWLGTSAAAVVFWFFYGPMYALRLKHFYSQSSEGEVHLEQFSGTDYDVIRENVHVSINTRRFNLLVSYIVFIAVMAGSGVSTYYLSRVKIGKSGFISAILTSIVVFAVNYAWKWFCGFLTRWEKHNTWSGFRMHNTIKFFLFKIINVLVLYISNELSNSVLLSKESNVPCVLTQTGSQFFWLIVLDVAFFNLIELVVPIIYAKLFADKHLGDEQNKPEFDTSEEYLEILYRQFIIFLGMTVFPLITVFGVVANVIEYYFDKMRMIYICQRSHMGKKPSMRSVLVLFQFLLTVAALASWPLGAGWILATKQSRSIGYHNCAFFEP